MPSLLPAPLAGKIAPTRAGEPDSRTMSRSIGTLLLVGCSCVLLWLALPHPDDVREWPILLLVLAGTALGATLLSGRADGLPTWAFELISAVGILMISVGVASSGGAGSGFGYLYLWVT